MDEIYEYKDLVDSKKNLMNEISKCDSSEVQERLTLEYYEICDKLDKMKERT